MDLVQKEKKELQGLKASWLTGANIGHFQICKSFKVSDMYQTRAGKLPKSTLDGLDTMA